MRQALLIGLTLTLAAPAASALAATPYPVEEVPLSQVADDLASGKTTSVAVTKAYIERIRKYDGPLHSVIRIAPDALAQAAASDKRRKSGKALSPLDGVPIMFKDNIDTVGMPTTAGSYAMTENLPVKDAEVARRLRAAGVIVLGKANTSQWAGFRTTKGFNGSTIGGGAHNPYDLTRTAAGSSSGSGIIAASSFAAGAIGSDTTGSVVAPSNVNGIVGLRPTLALVSRRGIVPVSSTQDTSGPMARTVKDVAMMLTYMAGSDPADPTSKDADANKTDYAKALSPDALKGKRIGVVRGFGGYDDTTKPVFEAALDVLKAQGAELVEIPSSLFEDLSPEQLLIMLYDIKPDMAAYLKNAPPAVKVRTLADIIAFNKTEEHEKLHSQDLFETAEATPGRNDPKYIQTVEYAKRRAGSEGYGKAMKDYNVSALVLLTGGPASVIRPDESGGSLMLMPHEKGALPPSGSGIAALAGYPDLVVPAGFVDGMPVAISFIGMPWSEATLLSYGYAYEQASHMRKPPEAYKKAVAGQ